MKTSCWFDCYCIKSLFNLGWISSFSPSCLLIQGHGLSIFLSLLLWPSVKFHIFLYTDSSIIFLESFLEILCFLLLLWRESLFLFRASHLLFLVYKESYWLWHTYHRSGHIIELSLLFNSFSDDSPGFSWYITLSKKTWFHLFLQKLYLLFLLHTELHEMGIQEQCELIKTSPDILFLSQFNGNICNISPSNMRLS